MVIRDANEIIKQRAEDLSKASQGSLPAMASPFDRIAAVVIDYFIVLLPLIYLVISPFQRSMKEAAIVDDQWQMTLSMSLIFLASLVLILFYQVVCIWLWGATVGKALMGLRVRSIWEEEISFIHSVSRAFFWVLSWLFFGVPFLATFSNYMRRPLHDRISDTVVVSTKIEKSVRAPNQRETSVVRGVNWAFGTVLFLIVASLVVSMLVKWQSESELISSLELEDVLCPAVSEAHEEWPIAEGEKEIERLNVAMALYAAGSIDRRCLEGETESLMMGSEDSLALLLARSFVYAEYPDRSDMYLEKVCADSPESEECHFSKIIAAVSSGEWDHVEDEFEALSKQIEGSKTSNQYMAIWGVRQFLKRDNYIQAKNFMKYVPQVSALSNFYLPAQAKILWGLEKVEEVSGIESIAYSTINDDAKLDLASFLCFEQIWNSCENKNSSSCKQVSLLANEYDDSLTTVKASLAYLRKWECDAGERPDYESLHSLAMQPDVRALVLSLSASGTEGFNDLLGDPMVDEELASEVSRRILERTNSQGLIKTLFEDWQSARQTLGWKKLGETLFNKYFERKQYAESLQVVDKLIANGVASSKTILEHATIAAIRSGQLARAKKILSNYARDYPLPNFSSDRMPANENSEFIEIVNQFIKGSL